MNVIEKVKGGLIVSCQAMEYEPLHGPVLMAAMAHAAAEGGAAAIRANGGHDIRLIKQMTGLPVFGIKKVKTSKGICITPNFAAAQEVVAAGADVVAVDARLENRESDESLEKLIPRIKEELGVPVMADVQTLADALNAQAAGANIVATTWSYHTTPLGATPDFALLEKIASQLSIPVIAEGGYWTPEEACRALDLGAWAVVVGTAITRPQDITRRFVTAIANRNGGQ